MSSNTPVTSDASPASEDSESRPARRRRSLYSRLYRVASRWRRVVVLGIYGAAAALAYGLGFLLRFEFGGWERWGAAFLATAPLVALLRIGLAGAFRLSVWRWRFISTVDVLRLFAATTAGSDGSSAPVGQAWTHSPQPTHVLSPIGSSKSNTIFASAPRCA